ncbi:uncharacterized protein LOC111711804 isoform X2 [Eurytemora carolleeae]|nr:uncharacterized protein LOC111711804 isoform X2 [Eurytemora carolleeae]|eukprot:XP_023342019.1 uncharacterized protein LOC111711804 isoform X2 [Eurytemora affinis]
MDEDPMPCSFCLLKLVNLSKAVFELTSALENSIVPPDSTVNGVGVITAVKKSVSPVKKAVSPVKKAVSPVKKALTPFKQNSTPVKEVTNSVKKSSITNKKVDQPRVLNEDVPPSNLNTSRRKSSRTRASLDPSASARVPQEPSKSVKETQSAARRLNGTPPYFKRERRGSLPNPTAVTQRLMEEQEDDPEDVTGDEDIREDASGYEATPSFSASEGRPKRSGGRSLTERNPDFVDIPQALQNSSSKQRGSLNFASPLLTPPPYKSTILLISDTRRALNKLNSAVGTSAGGTTAVGATAGGTTASIKRKSSVEDNSSLELSSKRNRTLSAKVLESLESNASKNWWTRMSDLKVVPNSQKQGNKVGTLAKKEEQGYKDGTPSKKDDLIIISQAKSAVSLTAEVGKMFKPTAVVAARTAEGQQQDWQLDSFRSDQLMQLDKALAKAGWKVGSGKNMEKEVFKNAKSKTDYIAGIKRLVSHFGVDPSIESEGKEEIIILEKSENNVLSHGKVVKSVSTCPPVRLPEKQRKMIRKPKKILKKKSALNKPSSFGVTKRIGNSRIWGKDRKNCPVCGILQGCNDLLYHLRTVHGDKACSECTASCYTQDNLVKHIQEAHKITLEGTNGAVEQGFDNMDSSSLGAGEGDSVQLKSKKKVLLKQQFIVKKSKSGKKGKKYLDSSSDFESVIKGKEIIPGGSVSEQNKLTAPSLSTSSQSVKVAEIDSTSNSRPQRTTRSIEERNPDFVVETFSRKSAEIDDSLETGEPILKMAKSKSKKVSIPSSQDLSFEENDLRIDEKSPFVDESNFSPFVDESLKEPEVENVAKSWFDINQG